MRQRGVALLMTLVFLPALAAGLAWLASGTQLMTRFEGHNQADRVAYSVGAQLARELNEVAVLNRKILASHLMVGHLTTYLSFTRYLKQVVDGVSSMPTKLLQGAPPCWSPRQNSNSRPASVSLSPVNTSGDLTVRRFC